MATATAEKAQQATYPDYSRLIANLKRDLEKVERDERDARTEALRYRAANDAAQLRAAIDNAERAQLVPSQLVESANGMGMQWQSLKAVQFDMEGRSGTVRIPPALDEFKTVFAPIKYQNYRWLTVNPLEIAWLDSQGRKRVPVGSCYARPPAGDGGEGIWVSSDEYHRMRERGMAL